MLGVTASVVVDRVGAATTDPVVVVVVQVFHTPSIGTIGGKSYTTQVETTVRMIRDERVSWL